MGTIAKDTLSAPAAAAFSGVHRNTIHKWIKAGKLPATRMPPLGNYRIKKIDLIKAYATEPTQTPT